METVLLAMSLSSLKLSEGFKIAPYVDTEGIITVGYGRNLRAYPYTQKDNELYEKLLNEEKDNAHEIFHGLFLKEHIVETHKRLRRYFDFFDDLTVNAQLVLIDMTYNLNSKIKDFKRMIKALENRDYETASKELIDSDFYRQTKTRGKRLAELIKRPDAK